MKNHYASEWGQTHILRASQWPIDTMSSNSYSDIRTAGKQYFLTTASHRHKTQQQGLLFSLVVLMFDLVKRINTYYTHLFERTREGLCSVGVLPNFKLRAD
jgi:hypothetical protein